MFLSRVFKSDRRRRERQMLNTSVRVFTDSGTMDALGINISDIGMCLFTAANLPVGSEIKVEFLPSRSRTATRLNATVRHRALYLYGIEFDGEPGQDATDPPSSRKTDASRASY
jgi:hypothetical protein